MGLFDFLKKANSTGRRLAIIDVTDVDFQKHVLRRSYKTPVVVDFWAAWCGPCRQLGPVLEKIAEEPDSDFILAKLDTEHNRQSAGQYHIHSIPNVKAFRNGQVVEEFTGALPEVLVRRFINKVVEADPPPPRIKGSPKPVQRLKQAEQHLRKGRGFEAFILLNNFPSGPQEERASRLLPMARFIYDMDDDDGLTGLEKLDEQYTAAVEALHKGKPAKAVEHLWAALDVGEDIDSDYTQEIIDSILILLGEEHPITVKNRELSTPRQ